MRSPKGIQDQGNAREPEQNAGNGAQSEGDSKKPAREQWAEQGTGIIEQHANQERAVRKVVEEAELGDEHRTDPQIVETT